VGFGDIARVLLRRRSNAEAIRELRDRFTFRVQDVARLDTPDLVRAEFAAGARSDIKTPGNRFIVASGRTFNIPIVVTNRATADLHFDASYRNASMESTAQNISVAPGKSSALFLRAVETQIGETRGRLTLKQGAHELGTDLRFDVRPLVPLRMHILDERGRPS